MIQELYQKQLMRLAADATGEGVMSDPDAETVLDNPTCGDRIKIQIKISDGKITALNHENRSCMLCQAAASVVGENAIGHSHDDITALRGTIDGMLKNNAFSAIPGWNALENFAPVAHHKSRHACVLLPFDALINVLSEAQTKNA
ncbi:iron-sulfur cluster assembly scaffold protein [Sneathiella marina]|uniref:Iron-sulfur cluster assembly scaffold protein n=1 Tax=Sneathiella marina TaxID=2950108 RepID=A0ABY4W357_9PROT|nr:iron-sulfur cluster assembly scaffold protein [Sneathiella marina]USG59719.1 iron-sulfur cluster assembly scaffold protein [Sneathiella marina]